MINCNQEQERALNRTARRALGKVSLPDEFIKTCYVWDDGGEGLRLGNFILYSGKLSNKDRKRFLSILPHLLRKLKVTAVASGVGGFNLRYCKYLGMLINGTINPGFSYLEV